MQTTLHALQPITGAVETVTIQISITCERRADGTPTAFTTAKSLNGDIEAGVIDVVTTYYGESVTDCQVKIAASSHAGEMPPPYQPPVLPGNGVTHRAQRRRRLRG